MPSRSSGSHVDRNPLLPFGPEAIGEQREVDGAGGAILRRALNGVQLVFVHRARVVEQAANQRALAIVDASSRADAQQPGGHQK